jgi:hypothetical protein
MQANDAHIAQARLRADVVSGKAGLSRNTCLKSTVDWRRLLTLLRRAE